MEERIYLQVKKYQCLCKLSLPINEKKCLTCKFEINKISKQIYEERMKDVLICDKCCNNLYCEKHQGCLKNLGKECELEYNYKYEYKCKYCQ